jgi:hypothetical protein
MKVSRIFKKNAHRTPHEFHHLHVDHNVTIIQHEKRPRLYYTMKQNQNIIINNKLHQMLIFQSASF